MKKLINDPSSVLADALRGVELAHPDTVRVDHENRLVVRADAPRPGKVGLVSGGGSGHEPMHSGFVGLGMLDAAACGEVFTSPTPDQVFAATVAVDGGAGVLHIVKNYTGDVLNFETAAELADMEGITVKAVVVNDDVAVEDSTWTAGRRGVAGTVLVEKIAGAAAERGDDLDAVVAVAEKVIGQVRSMGVALTACTVPHAGKPSFDLGEDEIEMGVGIHGEPGRARQPLVSANEITDQLVDAILHDMNLSGGQVLLFVNGMGGTPESELFIVYGHARERLEAAGLEVTRSLVGNYITSLEMQGCSVTVLKLDDELSELWDAPVNTAALRRGI